MWKKLLVASLLCIILAGLYTYYTVPRHYVVERTITPHQILGADTGLKTTGTVISAETGTTTNIAADLFGTCWVKVIYTRN